MRHRQVLVQRASLEDNSSRGDVMVDPPDVQRIFLLHQRFGWGIKKISKELGTSPNTVRRYLRLGQYQPYSRTACSILAWLKERFVQLKGNAQVLLRELFFQSIVTWVCSGVLVEAC
jgi:hypothetical protein